MIEGMKIRATPQAEEAVRLVREGGRANLVMVLSSGCCDSTAPFLYDDYLPDRTASPVGEVAGVTVMAPQWLVRLYPGDDTFVIDATAGLAEDSFSLETNYDRRFVLRAHDEGRG